jgi:hypothetical protein
MASFEGPVTGIYERVTMLAGSLWIILLTVIILKIVGS